MARTGGRRGQEKREFARMQVCRRIKGKMNELGDTELERDVKRTVRKKIKSRCS